MTTNPNKLTKMGTAPPRYTAAQKRAAVAVAAEKGIAAAAAASGAKTDTVARWCRDAEVTPHDGRKATVAATVVDKVTGGTITAAAERADRVADMQTELRGTASRQAAVVASQQRAAQTAADRVNIAYAKLAAAEAQVTPGPWETPEERQAAARAMRRVEEAAKALDTEIRRTGTIAVPTGIHIDKLLRLAGEDATTAAQGAAAVNVQQMVGALISDPEFRQAAVDRVRRDTVRLATVSDLDRKTAQT